MTVLAGPASELRLSASASSVPQGGSVTFTVTGEDEHGNPADTSGAVLSSSVATDVVDGLTVTFPTASPHVITATLGGLTASVTIEVVPPATTTTSSTTPTTSPTVTPVLPATGTSSAPLALVAVLVLAVGALTVGATRRP